MGIIWKGLLVVALSLMPWIAFAEQKPTLAPLCAGCHTPEPNMLMGMLDNISYKAGTIQLDLTSHKEIVKFNDDTKVKNVADLEEIKKYRGRAFRIDYTERKGEKVATMLTRFDVLKTLKPEDKISKEEFKRLMEEQKNLTVVDVRPLPRYEEGHVPGAIVIPAAAFDKHTDRLPADKKSPLVFYCVGGCSSPLAAVKAKSLGYTDVKVYVGGMPEWVQTEYVLIKPVYLKNAIEQDIPHVLIDLRETSIAEKGHIKGAVSIPFSALSAAKDAFPKQKTAPIILYGDKAPEAAAVIIGWGYKAVKILPMGYEDWKAAGNPTAEGKAKTSIVFVPKPKPGTIMPADFTQTVKNPPANLLLLDVRNVDEYENGHLNGAVNIPLEELRERIAELPKEKAIVIYCDTGLRAEMAFNILKEKTIGARYLDTALTIEKDGKFTVVTE